MSRRSLAIVIAVVLAAAAMTGVSAAFWSGGGGGTGSAADATNLSGVTVIAVSVGDSPTSALLPGGSADVIVKVANSNSFPVTVTSIRRIAGQPVVASNGCGPTGVSFSDQSGGWTVPAGSTGTVIDLPGAVVMDATSASACQGATFQIPVTVTAQQ